MPDYQSFFSARAHGMRKNEIRELLKLTRKPGMISFAGGLPAPDLFPTDEIGEIAADIIRREGTTALQYGPTEGHAALRDELFKLMQKEENLHLEPDQLMVTTSSQQGLDLVGKVFIDPGDIVLCGSPTYVGAIQAFGSYQADLRGVELDDGGIRIDKLEQEIIGLRKEGKKAKFIYVVADFQNPSGITLTLERRKQLIDIAETYDLLVIEDCPYRQLRFEGTPAPMLLSLNQERVIALNSFSKILLPGFRVGWITGPADLIKKIVIAKQAVDLCAPTYNQAILAEFMKRGLLEKQITKIIAAYRQKRDLMLEQLDTCMAGIDGIHWTRPQGGLFLWITLPEPLNATEMFHAAVAKNTAYVIGEAFDPARRLVRCMRLNFSFAAPEDIKTGIQRLAEVIKEQLKES